MGDTVISKLISIFSQSLDCSLATVNLNMRNVGEEISLFVSLE